MISRPVQNRMITLAISLLFLFSLNAFAQADGSVVEPVIAKGSNIYTESLAALTKLFVLAVLVESALSLIFNWRVFLEFFNKRAIKTLVMFLVSLTVVRTFDIDIVAQLMKVYTPDSQPGDLMSTVLTALIVAGGSSGVNNLFVALGFRSRVADQAVQPPRKEAWIAILVNRASATTGEVLVRISEDKSATTAEHDSIAGSMNPRKKLRDLFFPNRNRFPNSGGYKLEANKVYKITVVGKDATGAERKGLGGTYSFAPRAIVDLDVKL